MSERPLVCLHGFTGAPAVFSPLQLDILWSPLLAGHGPSPDLRVTSFQDELSRLAEELRRRTNAKVHLLGYSMGARVGLGLLHLAPELFSSATLVGLNPGLQSEAERHLRRAWETRWTALLRDQGLAAFEKAWAAQPIFSTQSELSLSQREGQRAIRLSHTPAGLAHAMEVLGLSSMPDYWPTLSALKIPVDLVFGARDEKFAHLMARAQLENPLFRAIAIPEGGHNPLLEAPDLITRVVLSSARERRV